MLKEAEVRYRHFSRPLNSILYLINFGLLLTVIFAGGSLVDSSVKQLFPDGSSTTVLPLDAVAFAIASLIVATPIYFVILFFLRRSEERTPLITHSLARKITYILISVVTFCFIVGILIAAIFSLILGTLTLASGISTFGWVVIMLIPLVYYLIQLRK